MHIISIALLLFLSLYFNANVFAQTPVDCADIIDNLREFGSDVQTTGSVPGTGDTMNYLVVGNPNASEAIVYIPGTNSIIPDWPVQLFTNLTSSPNLKHKFPNAQNSLCSEYILIFIDFPGVAGSTLTTTLSFDSVSQDISHAIESAISDFGLTINKVHVYGWSLGSLTALRFAEDNPGNLPLGTLFLSGTKPGGTADGNISGCVGEAWDLLETDKRINLERNIVRLMFPYENQLPYNGQSDKCSRIDKITDNPNVELSPCNTQNGCSTTPCSSEEMCGRTLESFIINRATGSKWEGGVPASVYNQQRALDKSYDACSCFPDDDNCFCSNNTMNFTPDDGSTCNCDKFAPNHARCFPLTDPTSSILGCSELSSSEGIVVFNAKEDIFIQWLYGFYLAAGYNNEASGFAKFINYDIDQGLQAGHGLPLQAPSWMQDKIYDHLKGSSECDVFDVLFEGSQDGVPTVELKRSVPTISQIGLISLACILGFLAVFTIHRRSGTREN
ncbi:MAG: hypothetical protein AAF462_09895 [Thermodesulfobacteriota bacterium]